MALIEYNPQYIQDEKSKAMINNRLEIKVYKDKITISFGLANYLRLTPGSKLSFFMDADNPIDWYLLPSTGGFLLRKSTSGHGLEISNRFTAKKFHAQFGDEKLLFEVAKAPVEIDGIKCYAIFTTKQAEAKRIRDLTTPKIKTA